MPAAINIEQVRNETRGCHDRIHFNNAGSSLMPAPVVGTLHDYLNQEELYGGYETVDAQAQALENFYQSCARLLNCTPGEIAYAENATRAWDMAFYAFRFEPGDRILTSIAEYGSNVIAYLQQARRYGAAVEFVPNDESGQLDVAALADLIDERVKLISISQIPTGGGLVNPAAAVGAIARDAGIPFLLDACQGVGQIPIDVNQIGCDMLSGTGRKFLRGPRGTGLLYVRESMIQQLEPPLLDQHAADLISPTQFRIRDDARRFENWEQYFAGKAALGVAVDYALALGLENIQQRTYALAGSLRSRLAQMGDVIVADEGREKCGIVTFHSPHRSALEIKKQLSQATINVSVSDGSGSLVSFEQRGITALVRASLHYFNTEEEVDRFVHELERILTQ